MRNIFQFSLFITCLVSILAKSTTKSCLQCTLWEMCSQMGKKETKILIKFINLTYGVRKNNYFVIQIDEKNNHVILTFLRNLHFSISRIRFDHRSPKLGFRECLNVKCLVQGPLWNFKPLRTSNIRIYSGSH